MPAPVFRYNQLSLSNTHRFETLIVDFHLFFLLYSSVFSVITILCVGVDLCSHIPGEGLARPAGLSTA